MKSLRIMAAASLSARPRDLPSVETPAAHRRPFASYEVTRSSWRKTGISSERANFRAMDRASADISLSPPSDSNGKPTTRAWASYSETISRMFDSSFFQLFRSMNSSGRVVRRILSLTAIPMRFVPGSRAINRPSGIDTISAKGPLLAVSFSCTQRIVREIICSRRSG